MNLKTAANNLARLIEQAGLEAIDAYCKKNDNLAIPALVRQCIKDVDRANEAVPIEPKQVDALDALRAEVEKAISIDLRFSAGDEKYGRDAVMVMNITNDVKRLLAAYDKARADYTAVVNQLQMLGRTVRP